MDARKLSGTATVAATTTLILASYVASLLFDVDRIASGCALGAYLVAMLAGPRVIETRAWGAAVMFPLWLALVAVLLAIDPGVMALSALAVVAMAVLYLRPRLAALVIALVTCDVVGSLFWRSSHNPTDALGGALSWSTALAFVIAFSVIAARQHDERRRATRLAAELQDALVSVEELALANERNRIAREIHDGLGHALTVAHIQLEAARELIPRDPDRAIKVVERVQAIVHEGLRDVRRSVGMLREQTRPRALREAIETWAAELRDEGIAVELVLPPSLSATSPAAAHVLYRAAQEAVTNVRRHAGASSVAIAIEPVRDAVRMRIADDGRGALSMERGFGLAGLRERVTALGGTVDVETAPGRGFALTLEVPRS